MVTQHRVDASRLDVLGTAAGQRPELVAQIWHPARPSAAERTPYATAEVPALARVFDMHEVALDVPCMLVTGPAKTMRLERERARGWGENEIQAHHSTMRATFERLNADGVDDEHVSFRIIRAEKEVYQGWL